MGEEKIFCEMFGGLVFSFYLCTHKRWQRCLSVVKDLSHGVMASTTGFGSVSQGSNPCGTTTPAGGGQRFSSLLQYRNTKHLLLSRETLWLGVTHDGDELIDSKLIQIVLWCNGSTTDSGPVCQGSNPCRTTAYHTYTVARVSRGAKISERAHSSAGLEHLSYKQRVIGSNPIGPTNSFRRIVFSQTERASFIRVKLFFLSIDMRGHPVQMSPYSISLTRFAMRGSQE